MQFYKPKQGDTASVVADGYATNFETLDSSKADAQATAEALAGKVDKADGKDLMTAPERQKLSGIEAGANAYTLPKASPVVLGGIKLGNNLTMRADGTVDAAGGSGGSGGSISYTIDANLTDVEAQKTALNGLLAAYNADPNVRIIVNFQEGLAVTATLVSVIPQAALMVVASLVIGEGDGATIITGVIQAVISEAGAVSSIEGWVVTSSNIGGAIPIASTSKVGGIKVGNNLQIDKNGTLSAVSNTYDLPVATAETLGGVKIGDNLTIDTNGRLNGSSLDLSTSEEVAVSGEFWASPNSEERKQVYFRFFHTGSMIPSNEVVIAEGIEFASLVYGGVYGRDDDGDGFISPGYYPSFGYRNFANWNYVIAGGKLKAIFPNGNSGVIKAGFKYTKI